MPLTMGLILGGAGLLKSVAVDMPQANRDRKLAAATQRFSPWTGLKANPVKEADPVGSAVTFGANGAMLGQNMQAAQSQDALNKSMSNYYNRGGLGSAPNVNGGDATNSFSDSPSRQNLSPSSFWARSRYFNPSTNGGGSSY